jgi:hypothetical protein
VVLVLVVYAVFFDYPGNTGDLSYLFGFGGRVLGGLAVLGTAILVRRAMQARAYLSLARLPSRAAYVRGVLLATCILRLPLFLELLGLYAWQHHRFPVGWPGPLLAGAVGLLLNCMLLAAVTVLLSLPIATRIEQILFLAWFVVALSSFALTGPPGEVLAFTRLPLLPFVACYQLGATGVIGASGLLAIGVTLLLILALGRLAEIQLARRDLLLH